MDFLSTPSSLFLSETPPPSDFSPSTFSEDVPLSSTPHHETSETKANEVMDDTLVVFETSDGIKFKIPKSSVENNKIINELDFSDTIPLPTIDSYCMEIIVEFLKQYSEHPFHHIERPLHPNLRLESVGIPTWAVEFANKYLIINANTRILYILSAAREFGLPMLFGLGCAKIGQAYSYFNEDEHSKNLEQMFIEMGKDISMLSDDINEVLEDYKKENEWLWRNEDEDIYSHEYYSVHKVDDDVLPAAGGVDSMMVSKEPVSSAAGGVDEKVLSGIRITPEEKRHLLDGLRTIMKSKCLQTKHNNEYTNSILRGFTGFIPVDVYEYLRT